MLFPKTLVLTESPFSSTNGFGVTLATLLAGWPREGFRVLYRSQSFWDDSCAQLQEARDRMVHMPLPGRPLRNPVHMRELLAVLGPYLLRRTPSWLGNYSRRWIEGALCGWRPNVIYCWYYSPVVADYGHWLSKQLSVPLVLHIGDDVPGNDTKSMRRIVREAAARIAISGEMKKDYEARFGAPFEVVHNGASEEIFNLAGADSEGDGTLVLRYVGSLLRAHHFGAIEDVAEAVRLYAERGGKVRFEIYSPDWTAELAQELAERYGVEYAGFAEKPRNYDLLKSADLLILPITFNEDHFRFVQLSMPTKLPEYLASGTPTLVYGPGGCAPVEFCVENNAGIVQSERSIPALIEILSKVDGNPEEARRQGERDRRTAHRTVSAQAMRERLRTILVRASGIPVAAVDEPFASSPTGAAGGERAW